LDRLLDFYKSNIAQLRFNWSDYDSILTPDNPDPVLKRVEKLWLMINCQFSNSIRKAPAGRYSKWLSDFTVKKFIKPRGRIGHTLCLKREQLMFFTRLCIGDREEGRVRLTELWREFEKRGIAFDYDSQRQIITLFEKLNMLEKKSDSGDAQYVRAVI